MCIMLQYVGVRNKGGRMTSTAPIGVFDSGLGGISVAREIRCDMPNERVLYFGDSANAPYGTKSPEQVRKHLFR